MSHKRIFRVQFINQGQVYELYVKEVRQPDLYGFIELEGLIFGERSAVVIDPSEERLKSEFAGVESSYVPLHTVIRVDRVEREGVAKIIPINGKTTAATNPIPFNPTDFPRSER